MASELGHNDAPFQFQASLARLDEGLETLHASVSRLRKALGRPLAEGRLRELETALGEIGANVLTHGSPDGSPTRVEYSLAWDGHVAVALFTDAGPPVHDPLARRMPDSASDRKRGLPLARLLLDELDYGRQGGLNRWRLVKRL